MKWIRIILIICLISLFAGCGKMTGSGTQSDPYVIYDTTDLQNVNNDLSAYYILNNDIDLNGVTFTPLGNDNTPFTGHFDGKNYTIKNLTINLADDTHLGLFGAISSAEVKNLKLDNFSLTSTGSTARIGTLSGHYIENSDISNIKITNTSLSGAMDIGGLTAYIWMYNDEVHSIENCSFQGTITENNSSYSVGGLANYLYTDNSAEFTLSCCNTTGSCSDNSNNGGGLIAKIETYTNSKLYVQNCWADFDLNLSAPDDNDYSDVGGFAGYISAYDSSYIEVSGSYALGGSKGNYDVGGFAGYVYNTSTSTISIKNCYAQGKSTINYDSYPAIGCFVGNSYGEGTSLGFEDCYGTGLVTNLGSGGVLGFLGSDSASPYDNGNTTCTDCFWDTQTSGASSSVCGTGKTTAEMYQQATYTNWDFTNIWSIDEGNDYPVLIDKCIAHPITGILSFSLPGRLIRAQ